MLEPEVISTTSSTNMENAAPRRAQSRVIQRTGALRQKPVVEVQWIVKMNTFYDLASFL